MPRVRVYPDTNILLHCRPLHALDWKRITGSDDVVVVLTSVVISEVDKKKHDASKHVRNRARAASTWLTTLRKEPARVACAGASFEVVRRSADRATLERHGLDAQEKDDCQLALILDDMNALERVGEVLCFTGDNLMLFKAEDRGIPVAEPEEADRRPEEVDDETKQLRDLQRQIAEHANAKPKLRLAFLGSSSNRERIEVTLRQFGEGRIERLYQLEEQWVRLNHLQMRVGGLVEPRDYLNDFRKWLREYERYHRRASLMSTLFLEIGNDSPIPAEHVLVDVRVPDHVYIDEASEVAPEPKAPARQRSFREAYELASMMPPIDIPFIGNPRVRADDDGHGLRFDVGHVHARDARRLPRAAIRFRDAGSVRGFDVTYEVRSAAAGEPVKGSVHVEVVADVEELELPVRPEEP